MHRCGKRRFCRHSPYRQVFSLLVYQELAEYTVETGVSQLLSGSFLLGGHGVGQDEIVGLLAQHIDLQILGSQQLLDLLDIHLVVLSQLVELGIQVFLGDVHAFQLGNLLQSQTDLHLAQGLGSEDRAELLHGHAGHLQVRLELHTLHSQTISKDNNVIFAYPLSSPFITQGVNGQPTISASSSFVSIKNKEVLLGDDAYIVNSALYSLQPTVIYSHIRISFLLILAGTLVAGIALMYLYLTDQKKETFSQEYNDEQMAQKLKSRKLDFPEVAPSQTEDDFGDDEIGLSEDFGDDQERLYDEYNLPEGAMDFPPPEEEDFQIPQEEPMQGEMGFNENFPPLEQTIAQESEEFVEPEFKAPEVDFSDIDSTEFVVQDFDSFDENIGLPNEELSEEILPKESYHEEEKIEDLDQSAVAQAQFSQENTLVAEEPVFSIDQALQGMEPPVKEVIKENVAMLNGAENVTPILPQDTEDVATAEPAGLFSPTTGFGWESYLEERLDSELIRSASAEEDIGLMMIRIQGMDKSDPRSTAIYEKLLEFYMKN